MLFALGFLSAIYAMLTLALFVILVIRAKETGKTVKARTLALFAGVALAWPVVLSIAAIMARKRPSGPKRTIRPGYTGEGARGAEGAFTGTVQ